MGDLAAAAKWGRWPFDKYLAWSRNNSALAFIVLLAVVGSALLLVARPQLAALRANNIAQTPGFLLLLGWVGLLAWLFLFLVLVRDNPAGRYALVWILGIPLVWLLLSAVPLQSDLWQPLPLLVAWTVVQFMCFVAILRQREATGTTTMFGDHHLLWVYIAVVLLVASVGAQILYHEISDRIVGSQSDGHKAGLSAASVAPKLEFVRSESNYLETLLGDPPPIGSAAYIQWAQDVGTELTWVQRYAMDADIAASQSQSDYGRFQDALKAGPPDQGLPNPVPVGGPGDLVGDSKKATGGILDTLKSIGDDVQSLPNATDLGVAYRLQSSVDQQLLTAVGDASATAAIAEHAVNGVTAPILAPFVWITALYTVMLVFPWLLFLLFLLRKRDDRVRQALNDLMILDGLTGSFGKQTITVPPGSLLDRALGNKTSLTQGWNGVDRDALEILSQLQNRTFSDFEYLISLTLLTTLSALGWYFVFFPVGGAGLANLILNGADIVTLGTYLSSGLTPITLGFVGAFFYIVQMIVRRYFSSDLYPTTFLQAAERLILVFILSLLLTIAVPMLLGADSPDAQRIATASKILAFLAGIYTSSFLTQLIVVFNKVLPFGLTFPRLQRAPLGVLDEITVWTESRLMEERVDTVQAMQTAEVDQLVLRTRFSTSQIIDWIDQAVLYSHAGSDGEWFIPFRATGITGATELLGSAHGWWDNPDKTSTFDERIQKIVTAVNTVREKLGDRSDLEPKPATIPLTSEMLVEMCKGLLPDPNLVYVLRYRRYAHASRPTDDQLMEVAGSLAPRLATA